MAAVSRDSGVPDSSEPSTISDQILESSNCFKKGDGSVLY